MANDGLRGFPEYVPTVTGGASVNYAAQGTALTLPSTVGGANLAITPTADITVTLPSAVAMQPAYVTIKNLSSAYTLVINDNAGNYLFAIGPSAVYYIWAFNTATAAGQWASEVTPTDVITAAPNLLLNGCSISTNGFANGCNTISGLNATQAIKLYNVITATSNNEGLLYAVIVTTDGTNITSSAPILVSNAFGVSYNSAAVVALTATTGVISYKDVRGYVQNVAFSVSGTTITLGTQVQCVSFGGSVAGMSSVMLSSTTALVLYAVAGPKMAGTVLTLTGLTITLGVENISTGPTINSSGGYPAASLSSTLVAVLYSGSSTNISANTISISGTGAAAAITFNTASVISAADYSAYNAIAATSSTAFFTTVQYVATNNLDLTGFTVSGTTLTKGSSSTIETVASSANQFAIGVSSTGGLVYRSSGGTPKVTFVSISGSTATAQTTTTLNATVVGGMGGAMTTFQVPAVAAPVQTAYSIATYINGTSGTGSVGPDVGNVFTNNGTTAITSVSASKNVAFNKITNPYNVYMAPSMAALSATQALLLTFEYSPTTALAQYWYLYATLLTITTSGYTVTSRIEVAPFGNASYNSFTSASICALSSTQAIATWYSTGGGTTRATTINVSGSTLTLGAVVDVGAVASTSYQSIAALSSTSAAIAICASGATTNYLYALTVSGTTITVGTGVTTSVNSPTSCAIVALSATTGVVFNIASSVATMQPFTVSGTTATFIASGTYLTNSTLDVLDSAFSYVNFYPVAISPTRFIVSVAGTGTVALYVVDVVNGVPAITSGRGTSLVIRTPTPNTTGLAIVAPFSATKGFLITSTCGNTYSGNGPLSTIIPYTINSAGAVIYGAPVQNTMVGNVGSLTAVALAAPAVAAPSGSKAAVVYVNTNMTVTSGGRNTNFYEGRVYYTTGAIV